MADEVKEEVIETPEEEKEVEEVDKSFDEILETPEEEEEVVEEVEEPEEVVEEEETPIKDVVKEALEEVKKDAEAKADATKERVLEAVGVSDVEKKDAEEAGFKFAWEERGEDRPASWKEQSEETIKLWEHMKTQQDTQLAEDQKKSMEEAEAKNTQINSEWDSQLDYLVEEGIIPSVDSSIQEKLSKGKVLSKEEREDPGLKARAEIFETMYVVAQQREAEQKPPIADAIHIYSRYIAKKDKKPAGHSAPVSGGRKAVVTPEEDMSYEELKKASFEDLI